MKKKQIKVFSIPFRKQAEKINICEVFQINDKKNDFFVIEKGQHPHLKSK